MKSFDALVVDLNTWFEGAKKGGWKRNVRVMLGLVPHPLYSRSDLTGWQVDSVSLASNWVRAKADAVREREELIKEFGESEYKKMLTMADDMYVMYKREFYGSQNG